MSGHLWDELLLAQTSLRQEERGRLIAAGVSPVALAFGWVGALNAARDGDYWQPVERGARVFVVPVKIFDPVTPEWPEPEDAVTFGDLVDLVAFRLDAPERWALRVGSATWLGACEPQFLVRQVVSTKDEKMAGLNDLPGRPVLVHRTPLDWLRHAGRGVAPLVRERAELRRLLMVFQSMTTEDVDHSVTLQRLLEQPFPLPQIFVRRKAAQEIVV